MLSHALEVIRDKAYTSDEMDVVQETENLPGLQVDAITTEFIEAWRVSGHQEKAPCLFEILLAAAETASAKEKNKKKSPLAVSSRLFYFSQMLSASYTYTDLQCNHEAAVLSTLS